MTTLLPTRPVGEGKLNQNRSLKEMLRRNLSQILFGLTLTWTMSWAQSPHSEQKRFARFRVWPPEAQAFVILPESPAVELGSSKQTFEFDRERHFPMKSDRTRVQFIAPGYQPDSIVIDWKELDDLTKSEGYHPHEVRLVPTNIWTRSWDRSRRFPETAVFLGVLFGVVLTGGFLLVRRKRFQSLHKLYGGNGEIAHFADYILFQTLGEGFTAKAYLCCEKKVFYRLPLFGKAELKELAVLKEISTNFQTRPDAEREFEARVRREVRSLKLCRHKNIISILTSGVDQATGRAYIIMERAPGKSLVHFIQNEIILSLKTIRKITRQLCEALQHMHDQGLVHRDVKPANIILAPDQTIKLVDLGIAKTREEVDALTEAGHSVGTPFYQPYWQKMNSHIPDPSADQYAVAVCLAELLMGTGGVRQLKGHKPLPKSMEIVFGAARTPATSNLKRFFEKILRTDEKEEMYESMKAFLLAFEEAMESGRPRTDETDDR